MRLARSECGAALLEFSLIVPLVVLMFLAVVDFGIVIANDMTMADAARAGAEYGTLPGNGDDVTGMQNAAAGASSGVTGFSAVASRWCTCTPGGAVLSCTSSCTSAIPIKYVQVQTSATVQVLAGYPGIPNSFALSGLAVLRVQ